MGAEEQGSEPVWLDEPLPELRWVPVAEGMDPVPADMLRLALEVEIQDFVSSGLLSARDWIEQNEACTDGSCEGATPNPALIQRIGQDAWRVSRDRQHVVLDRETIEAKLAESENPDDPVV
jgi:hypothetical protein